jgi:ribosome-associated translation inhibitor RaiA
MDVRIKVTDFEMNSQVEDYLDERIEFVEKHLGDDADHARCEVELGRAAGHSNKGENWFAEFHITYPGADLIRVVGHGTTVNGAIDAAKEELLVTMKKGRSIRITESKKLGAKIKNWLRWGK